METGPRGALVCRLLMLIRRKKLIVVAALVLLLAGAMGLAYWFSFLMPGESYSGPLNPGSTAEGDEGRSESNRTEPEKVPSNVVAKPSLEEELRSTVEHLAETIGERNLGQYRSLTATADYIEEHFQGSGLKTSRQEFVVRGLDCFNVIGEIKGASCPDEIVIVGAHYDSVPGCPGANDNGSGTAAMLSLVNRLNDSTPDRTVRFVGFVNEEPPYFQQRDTMGSWVYARECRRNDDEIVAVLSLETMGYFTDEPDSQKYPAPLAALYPSTGNFVGFVSNLGSRPLLQRALRTFREHARVPSEGASLPGEMPASARRWTQRSLPVVVRFRGSRI